MHTYYDTLDCDDLPLTHALAAFPYWCKEDDLNWITVSDFGRNTYFGRHGKNESMNGKPLPGAIEVAYRLKPEELLLPDGEGNTPLHLAASYGNLRATQTLLNAGAQVEVLAHGDRTPLLLAADLGHTMVVKELLKRGANPNVVSVWEQTPLNMATAHGHKEVVALLKSAGAVE